MTKSDIMGRYTKGRFKCDYDCFNCKENDCRALDHLITQHETYVRKNFTIHDDIPQSFKAELVYYEIANGNNFRKGTN